MENKTVLSLKHMISICLLSILMCLGSLFSLTWALFRTNIDISDNVIQSGIYEIETVITSTTSLNEVESDSYTYNLSSNYDVYDVSLNAKGSSNITGYALINVKYDSYEEVYYTNQITSGTTMNFQLENNTNKEVVVTVDYIWGTFEQSENYDLIETNELISINNN